MAHPDSHGMTQDPKEIPYSMSRVIIEQFVEATEGRLKLLFLPPYSPEINPDELVWNNLKTMAWASESSPALPNSREWSSPT